MTPNRSCIAILALAVLVTFGAPLAVGLSWFPTPQAAMLEDQAQRQPAGMYGVDNFTFPNFEWPARVIARQAHEAGELPLWNPYAGLGFPMIGQYETQILFPLEIAERFTGPRAWDLFLLLKVFLAGFGAFVFLRCVASNPVARLAGALLYALSGYFAWFTTMPAFVNAAMMVPWVFAAAVAVVDRGLDRRAIGGLGIASGLMLLAGQPQIAALSFMGCTLFYAVSHAARDTLLRVNGSLLTIDLRKCASALAPVVLALSLGLVIALPQVLYFLEALRHGYTVHYEGAYAIAGITPTTATAALWPYLLGQIQATPLYPESLNWETFPLLIGASGLLLGMLGAVHVIASMKRKEGNAFALAMLALLIVGLTLLFSISAASSAWKLPVLSRINFPRYVTPALSLCLAALVAYALARLEKIRTAEYLTSAALSLFVVVLCLAVVWPALSVESVSLLLGFAPFLIAALSVCIALAGTGRIIFTAGSSRIMLAVILFAEFSYFVRYGFTASYERWRVAFVVAVCLAALCLTIAPRIAKTLLAIGCLLPALLLALAKESLPVSADYEKNPSALIHAIRELLGENSINGRLMASGNILLPNAPNIFGIAQLEALAPVQLKDSARIILSELSSKPFNTTVPISWHGELEEKGEPSWEDFAKRRPFYDLLSARLLVDSAGGWLARNRPEGIAQVWSDGKNIVYENRQARPRAYLVRAEAPATAYGPELESLPKLSIIPDLQALAHVETLPGAVVQSITPNTLRVDIQSSGPALLVVADAYFPSWRVSVDGEDRRLIRVAGGLRGVFVKPGELRAIFTFRPRYLQALLAASLLGWLAAGLLVFWRKCA